MKNHRASVLIFVLWALIILSLLSIAVSYHATADVKLAKYESESIKAFYLARIGAVKMLAGLNKDENDYDSLNEDWNKEKEFKLGGGKVIYSASDEEGRFNLNSSNLDERHLARLGASCDLNRRILDYRIGKGDKGFEFIEELFLIDGMNRDIYLKIQDLSAIHRGNDPRVNINTASEDVLRIIMGDDLIIDKIIKFRNGDDDKIGTGDDGIFTEDDFSAAFKGFGLEPDAILSYGALFKMKSNFFRITAKAYFSEDSNVIKCIVAVADRSGKIYDWKEE